MKYTLAIIFFLATALPALAADAPAPRLSQILASWLVRVLRIPRVFVADEATPASQAENCKLGAMPVCGMDGKTYPNRCAAGDAPIASDGTCAEVETKQEPSRPPEPAAPFVIPPGLVGSCTDETTCMSYCKTRWYVPACHLPTLRLRETPGLFGNVPSSTAPAPQPSIPRQFLPSGQVPAQPVGRSPSLLDLFREFFLRPR